MFFFSLLPSKLQHVRGTLQKVFFLSTFYKINYISTDGGHFYWNEKLTHPEPSPQCGSR